jgi:hypothetical protein
MLVVETIAKIRRAYFVQKKPIKEICRDLRVSRKVVRKVIRSDATEFRYERETQPLPKIGPWREQLDGLLLENDGKPARERLTLVRLYEELYRVPKSMTLGRFPNGGESDLRRRTEEVRHVGPLRQDFDASQLRGLARRSKDGPQARRLLALAAIYDGATRTEAAKIGGVGLQIIRDWVLRFNARGPNALVNGKSPGHPSKLNDLQRQAIAEMIERGPIPRSMAWCAGG